MARKNKAIRKLVKPKEIQDSPKVHGCKDCGEERIPRTATGKLTCPECGSENIVCIE
jgi:ribosomal protein L37AE/L43A